MKIAINTKNKDFFNALGSKTRLKIIELLLEGSKNIKEIANILNLSSTIIAKHINILEKASIINTESIKASRGTQKICKLIVKNFNLIYEKKTSLDNLLIQKYRLPVGHFSSFKVEPTCGLATTKTVIGICDDPRYFSHPERLQAGILWFASGWVEYKIPSFLFTPEKVKSIEISLELCSECPGVDDHFPSDIYFEVNSVNIGSWTSPGDFGSKKGKYTPNWWYMTEYGILKTIIINEEGTFVDKKKISNVTVSDLVLSDKIDNTFKIISPKDTTYPGGINLMGKGFGNTDQGININISHIK